MVQNLSSIYRLCDLGLVEGQQAFCREKVLFRSPPPAGRQRHRPRGSRGKWLEQHGHASQTRRVWKPKLFFFLSGGWWTTAQDSQWLNPVTSVCTDVSWRFTSARNNCFHWLAAVRLRRCPDWNSSWPTDQPGGHGGQIPQTAASHRFTPPEPQEVAVDMKREDPRDTIYKCKRFIWRRSKRLSAYFPCLNVSQTLVWPKGLWWAAFSSMTCCPTAYTSLPTERKVKLLVATKDCIMSV